jgi:hypothetical protein
MSQGISDSGNQEQVRIRLYRRLARAYPHEFRMICGDEMERLGGDAAPEIWRRYGFTGMVRLLADIAMRLPGEYLSELRQDVRYSFRRLRQAPGFTAVSVLSLAMGIGMAVMFFANIQVMILRPVPGTTDPERLATPQRPVSYAYFESYREHREIAASAMAFLAQVPFSVATRYGTINPHIFTRGREREASEGRGCEAREAWRAEAY